MTAPAAHPPSPVANPLDTPETREVLFARLRELVADYAGFYCDTEIHDTARDIADALAPHVLAAQRAAFRAGVEAAAEVCDRLAAVNHARTDSGRDADLVMGRGDGQIIASNEIRALSVPDEFATPAPSPDAQRAAFRHGREVGRADAVGVCERYAAREREARDAAYDICDDAEEADCERDARIAEGIAAYIEMLGPVEEAEEPEEYGAGAEAGS